MGTTAEFMKLSGAAIAVAEAAVAFKDFVECFDPDDLHWWTVRYSSEYGELLESIREFELNNE